MHRLETIRINQINVSPPPNETHHVEIVDTFGDRTAAVGVNLVTGVAVLVVLIVVAWYLFTGPLRGSGGRATTVNVNTPALPAPTVNINVNPPVQPAGTPPPGSGGGNNAPTQAPSKP